MLHFVPYVPTNIKPRRVYIWAPNQNPRGGFTFFGGFIILMDLKRKWLKIGGLISRHQTKGSSWVLYLGVNVYTHVCAHACTYTHITYTYAHKHARTHIHDYTVMGGKMQFSHIGTALTLRYGSHEYVIEVPHTSLVSIRRQASSGPPIGFHG